MQDLTVTLLQTPLHWQDSGANLAMLEEKLWQIPGPTDLIILPEMFNSGFSMEAEKLAEPMNLTTFRWMKQMAAQTGAVITGSFIIKEQNRFYNRLIWMQPDGRFEKYDKRHLFRMAQEHDHFSQGDDRLVITLKNWKICPMICYDLRFPVWSRNNAKEGPGLMEYDVLIYVANWPAARISAWDTLLKARAMENLSYSIGVNRIGEDGNNILYNGHSQVHSPKGETLYHIDGEEAIHTMSLSYESLISFRKKFPTYLDADRFTLEN